MFPFYMMYVVDQLFSCGYIMYLKIVFKILLKYVMLHVKRMILGSLCNFPANFQKFLQSPRKLQKVSPLQYPVTWIPFPDNPDNPSDIDQQASQKYWRMFLASFFACISIVNINPFITNNSQLCLLKGTHHIQLGLLLHRVLVVCCY